MHELLLARGVRPQINASREQLEQLLMSQQQQQQQQSPAELKHHELYGHLLSSSSMPEKKESLMLEQKTLSFGDMSVRVGHAGADVTVIGRCGTVTSSATVDWSDRRLSSVIVSVSERPESCGMIPNTFRRREGGVSEGSRSCASVISDVIRSSSVGQFSDGFPHPCRVTSQVLVSGGHFNPMAHVVASGSVVISVLLLLFFFQFFLFTFATVTALRLKGYPVSSVGACRVGLLPDGTFLSDPGPEDTENSLCIVSMVVSGDDGDSKGPSIVYLEVDAKFVSEDDCEKVIKEAFGSASRMCKELSALVVPWRVILDDITIPPDLVADFPTASLIVRRRGKKRVGFGLIF